MRFLPLITILLLPVIALSAPQEFRVFHNELMPFSSDGCSRFPDSFFKFNWKKCCIEHDIAYWAGGTKNERLIADQILGQCVTKKTGKSLGMIMQEGVKLGGIAELPTSWRWGYGWKVSRGYSPHSDWEDSLINQMTPQEVSNIEISSQRSIPFRETVSGDYCVDLALSKIARVQKTDSVSYKVIGHTVKISPEGYINNLEIQTRSCEISYRVRIQTLLPNSCVPYISELFARSQIRVLSLKQGCAPLL